MSEVNTPLSVLRDPRLAPHATAGNPAWLWSTDGTRLLWANPTGAAIFGFDTSAACAQRSFSPDQLATSQIARLAGTLSLGGNPRLEMLRGFGAGFGRALLCACSRVALDFRSAILVVASQPAGPNFSLAERARRLIGGLDGAFAAFTADGELIGANTAAKAALGQHNSLSAIGALPLAAMARDSGRSNGTSEAGPVVIDRVGNGANVILLAAFPDVPAATASLPVEEPDPEPAPAPIQEERRALERTHATPEAETPPLERRHPLRFVWQMDAQGRFSLGAGDFTDVIGPSIASTLGRPWDEIAPALGIDPEGRVAKAIGSHDTWSGIQVQWPIEGSHERIDVELSGLPIYDRDRAFRGYRGFGVCRDIARISEILANRAKGIVEPAAPRAVPDAAATPVEAAPAEAEAIKSPPPPAEMSAVPASEPPAEPAPAGPKSEPAPERPALTVVPAAQNIVPFRPMSPDNRNGVLSPLERNAFSELAKQLSARLRDADDTTSASLVEPDDGLFQAEPGRAEADPLEQAAKAEALDERPLLSRLPVGVLVHRHGQFLFANRVFLGWAGHETLSDFEQAGGLDTLFLEDGKHEEDGEHHGQSMTIETPHGGKGPTQAQLFTIPWDDETAMALVLMPAQGEPQTNENDQRELRELKSILDTATDGILVIDDAGRIITSNHGAQALFGHGADAFGTLSFPDLFEPESKGVALDYLHRLSRDAMSRLLNDGREVIGRVREGGLVPLFMTLGRLEGSENRFCAVFRDISQWKRNEEELTAAKQDAERASSAKSEFLAKVSHEIRTPLNAILGFSEVMIDGRFGPIGNERYREYLKDIHASGSHLVSLLNDLLDLSKIEAGKLDLTFSNLNLNDLTQQSVAIMQPEANKERIIIRTSLPATLPQVVADARSVRQIILNLLSNSIKFTGAGGQVIVSTAVNDNGEVVLRVRDTGTGMSESDIALALEPFRQLATSMHAAGQGTGLGLPLTKALAEANRASFSIKSAENSGTLVEIAFPKTRIPAE